VESEQLEVVTENCDPVVSHDASNQPRPFEGSCPYVYDVAAVAVVDPRRGQRDESLDTSAEKVDYLSGYYREDDLSLPGT